MKLKIEVDYKTSPDISEYFKNSIKYSLDKVSGVFLFWLYSSERNYYLLDLKTHEEDYIACTPFIFIHRTSDNIFHVEDDINGLEDIIKYPYLIETKGCDDGHKLWRFETLEECSLFLCEFVDSINQNLFEDTNNFYDIWEYFEKNQCWRN